jgi:regulator of nonsense transcripts 2
VGLHTDRRKIISQYLGDLFKVPLQLLPFYARIVATLSQQYRDIGTAVGAMVVRKVRGLTKKVDATNRTAEPRVASARYLAELAKFRVVDPGALSTYAICNVCICMIPMKYLMQ